jgi:PhzF family phenazine biosynthesis protein
MYHVDAFTEKLFSGNPAAVCILDSWLDDNLMQSIAIENNLPETAFIVPDGRDFAIRWFSPAVEIDLCGHATLASAYVIFNELDHHDTLIRFHSPKSGLLMAKQTDDLIALDFPSDTLTISSEEEINFLENCLGIRPLELHKGKSDYLAVVDNESILQEIKPDFKKIALLDARGVMYCQG